MKFTRIPETAFQKLQLNAGALFSDFDPATGSFNEEDQIGATSGGITFTAQATYSDFAEDIDNAPRNMKEYKKLDYWDVTMSGEFVTLDVPAGKDLVGAADIDEADQTKIVPRNDVLDADFKDVWWVGDYSDKNGDTNGGFVAIHMMSVLSTGGFQLQSGNREKGHFPFEYTAHYSNAEQDTVPFEVYIKSGTPEPNSP